MDDTFEDGNQCELCGSRSFHIESGLTICENGHDQGRAAVIGEDEGDYGTQGKLVQREKEKRVKVLRVFRGKKAYKLFLQAYQFILWKQCHALVHEKKLPAELWTIVRDLWILRLSSQRNRLEVPGRKTKQNDDQSSSAQETEEDTDFEQLNANQSPSSRKASQVPTLVQTIALCYLGTTLLRLPISLATFSRWIREEGVVYLRAIRHVPADLKDKLPGNYHEALDTLVLLTEDRLQDSIFQLQRLYQHCFSMTFPPINWKIILFEHIKNLGLPLEVFSTAQNLNRIVGYDFKSDLSRCRRRAISLADAQLMSLLIVTVKLIYPFDSMDRKRGPRSLNEPAAQRIDWNAWGEAHTKFNCEGEDGRLQLGKEAEVKDADALAMSEQQLEDYMDWYQRTWTRPVTASENMKRNVLDQFPLKPLPLHDDRIVSETAREARVLENLYSVQSSLHINPPILDGEGDSEILRPGANYSVFRSTRELDSFPYSRLFHEAAAKLACLSLQTLLRAVTQTERRITTWRRAKRRSETFGGEIDLEAEGGASMGGSSRVLGKIVVGFGLSKDLFSEEEENLDEADDKLGASDVEGSE